MTSSITSPPQSQKPQTRNSLLSWQITILQLLLLALAAIMLNKPVGSLTGRIGLQQEGFDLYSYDMKGNHVYAIAIGPRDGVEEERGVWVDSEGKFKIDNLPVGEYSVRLRVPGFSTTYESGVFVNEGKLTEIADPILLEIAHPSVSTASNLRVFTSKETPSFWTQVSDSKSVHVRVYKKDMLDILKIERGRTSQEIGLDISPDLSIYKPYDAQDFLRQTLLKTTPLREFKRNVANQDYSHEEFKFEKPLDPGDYIVLAEAANVKGETDWNITWFSVTNLGLVIKQDQEKIVARAMDLATLKPVAGVDLSLLNRDTGVVKQAKKQTDSQGFAVLNDVDTLSGSGTMLVLGRKGKDHAYGGMSIYSNNRENRRTYFYTERPVYRLGQTIYYKGICRMLDANGFHNSDAGDTVHVHFEDPDNVALFDGDVKVSKHGTFNGLLEVPAEGKTGAYQIKLDYDDGSTDYESVEVMQYRKPEYKVEVTPLEDRVVCGQKAKAKVRATYYFGAPVTNAKVKYSIYMSQDGSNRWKLLPRPDYYSYYDDWEGSDSDYYSGGGEYVTEGYVQTDDTGEATIEFDTKPVDSSPDSIFAGAYTDRRYKVDVEVTDISRLSVLGSGSLQATAGDFALYVDPKSHVVPAGEKFSADITAVSYDGAAMPRTPVTISLMRRLWDKNQSEYKGTRVYEETTVFTDDKGIAHVDFQTTTKEDYRTDTYYIVARSEDREHHRIMNEDSIWVSSADYPYYSEGATAAKQALTVTLDKTVYKPGETARVLITAPVTGKEGAQAIVAIEGMKLYSWKVIDLKSTATYYEIPLNKDQAPNVYVTVTMVGAKHQFYNESQMIRVSPQDHFLNVKVTTDKNRYKPGDIAEYTLQCTDAGGKPAANVELSMGVVDESIYAIRPEYVQDIKKYFYDHRSNLVNTICTFPEENSGGPNKIEPRVRKDFKDTAIWVPSLVTDSKGIAKTKVKMPDNLTTWRATVRGVSLKTEVGWCLQKVVSTQDLIVRLALPRFFTQGDEGQISAIVHNYSEVEQNIALTLGASSEFGISKSLNDKVKVAPDKAVRVSWPTKILRAGTGTISIKAVGQTAGDAMEIKLPIRGLGVPVFASKSGMVLDDSKDIELPMAYPADAAEGSVKTTLSISCSTLGPILGNFKSLIDYPYGCTEQTMSKLMPSAIAMRIHKSLAVPLPADDVKRFREVYDMAMAKLYEYNHSDGGWGWWATDESSMYLTSLVLEGFKLLKEEGFAVEDDRIKRGLDWLESSSDKLLTQLSDPKLVKRYWQESELVNDLAKAAYVRALHGRQLTPKLRAWITNPQLRNRLAPEALCYFTLALKLSGNDADAQTMYERLVQLGNQINAASDMTMLNWERTDDMYKKMAEQKEYYYYWYSYRFTGVETTALALRTVVAMEPSNVARIEGIKQWILTQRGKDGWGNTKTTSEVLRAFTDAETTRNEGYQPVFDLVMGDGSASNSSWHFDSKSISEPELSVPLALTPGAKPLVVHKKGKGTLYWTMTQTYYKKLKPGDQSAVPSTPDKLSVRREFFRLVASTPDAEGKVHFTQEPLKGSVKAGETLLMRVSVDSPLTIPYTCLEAALPSGGEVVSKDPKEDLAEQANESSEIETDYGWSWWWNHQDVLDDHLAYFVTHFPNGKHELHTMVRMELPGKFQMNPVTLEGMYTDKVHGYSQAQEITVTE